MKIAKLLICLPLLAPLACDDSNDPSVLDQSSLAPPTGLVTVTGTNDGEIELRWQGANFEDGFVGYHVFQATADIDTLKTASNPLSPLGVDITKNVGLPRCAANNSFFAAFGVTAGTESQCSDIDVDAPVAADTDVGVQKAKVLCYSPSDGSALGTADTTSLDKTSASDADGTGIQRCLVKGLTTGTTYSFLVVAVAGSSFEEISWTSNVVEDTPATKVFSGSVTIPAGKYATITFDSSAAAVAPTVTHGSSALTCSATICGLAGSNSGTTPTIYLARDSESSSYPQRVFASAGSGSALELAFRGPRTLDPVQGEATVATSIPGDQALAADSGGYGKGQKVPVYDNMVFDIEYTVSGAVHFGKLVIGNLEYPNNDKSADVSFTATILMQSQANQVHYEAPQWDAEDAF